MLVSLPCRPGPALAWSAVAAAAAALATPALAAAWPELGLPPRTTTQLVAGDSVVNGRPTRIEEFQSELTVDEVLAFYRRAWHDRRLGEPRSLEVAGWQTVSMLRDGHQMMVQAKPRTPGGGSTGMLSIINFKDGSAPVVPAFLPSFPDTRVMQVTESRDGPRRSQLISLSSNASLEVSIQRWRSEWLRRGWQLTFDRTSTSKDGDTTWLASFDKPPQSLDIVAGRDPSGRAVYLTVNLLSPPP